MEHGAEHTRRTHSKKGSSRPGRVEQNRTGVVTLLKHGAIGAGVALLVATVLLFLGAALCMSAEDPNTLTTPIGLIVLYLSAFIGGIVAVRLNRGGILPCGGLCGGFLLLFFWFLTLFFDQAEGNIFSFGLSLLLRGLILPTSILGGLIGARRPTPRRHRRTRS